MKISNVHFLLLFLTYFPVACNDKVAVLVSQYNIIYVPYIQDVITYSIGYVGYVLDQRHSFKHNKLHIITGTEYYILYVCPNSAVCCIIMLVQPYSALEGANRSALLLDCLSPARNMVAGIMGQGTRTSSFAHILTTLDLGSPKTSQATPPKKVKIYS